MITYLIRSILCLAILLLVYLLFLEKEKMHRFNRWYLLGSIVFACLIPLVRFEIKGQPLPVFQDTYFEIIDTATSITVSPAAAARENTQYTVPALLLIYGLITSLLLTRFCINIYRILSRAAKNKAVLYRGARLILLKDKVASHSFLNYIFISEEDYADQSLEKELITHELTHVKEKHSWDVIFIELLQSIFWFNPLFIFYKKAVQLNHEYLADDAVIKTYGDVPAYQYLLLDKAGCNNPTYLTSNFNYSITKKRLVMMTRTTNHVRTIFKKIALFPILAGALFLFSSKTITAQEKLQAKKSKSQQSAATPPELLTAVGKMPYTEEGVSAQVLDEYNNIIKKYLYTNERGLEAFKKNTLTGEERNRLEIIFKKMSKIQQQEVKAGFTKRPARWSKTTPTDEQFEKWKDETKYGVWIDGKKIKNEELNKYKASDFSHYSASNLNYTEEMKQNVMKSFNLKVMYKIQLNLMTPAEYDKYYAATMAGPEYQMFHRLPVTTKDGKKRDWRVPIN
jgi:bla regulator protein BlaR1